MATASEQIRTKIAETEAKLADLRIALREFESLEKQPAQNTRAAPAPKVKRAPKAKAAPKPAAPRKTRSAPKGGRTIGADIQAVLEQHGSLSAAEIAEQIKATGRDITNRTVSFALQAQKKKGAAKNTDGKWSLVKGRR
jgi:ribosomal protein L9